MKKDKLNIGIVGVDFIGETYVNVYSNLDSVRIAAIADTSINNANKLAKTVDVTKLLNPE